MKKLINKIKIIIQSIDISYIDEYAAVCSYYTIFSFIPLILLILTLSKYLGIDENFLINILEGLIPGEVLNDAVISIVKEVQSKSVGTITISAVVTLWSAGKGFFALCKGLSYAYQVKYENKFMQFRLRSMIATIIFIIAVIITFLLLVFGNKINLFLQQKFNIFSSIINWILKSKILISTVLLSVILVFVYRYIPKHEYKLKKQIPGAIIAATSCNIVSIFYSIYVEIFTGFSFMYGSLTTIVLAMLWIYACMYSILIGGYINSIICRKIYLKNSK